MDNLQQGGRGDVNVKTIVVTHSEQKWFSYNAYFDCIVSLHPNAILSINCYLSTYSNTSSEYIVGWSGVTNGKFSKLSNTGLNTCVV